MELTQAGEYILIFFGASAFIGLIAYFVSGCHCCPEGKYEKGTCFLLGMVVCALVYGFNKRQM